MSSEFWRLEDLLHQSPKTTHQNRNDNSTQIRTLPLGLCTSKTLILMVHTHTQISQCCSSQDMFKNETFCMTSACVCVSELLNMLFSLHVCVCVNMHGPAFIRFNCALFEVKRTEAVCQIHSEI